MFVLLSLGLLDDSAQVTFFLITVFFLIQLFLGVIIMIHDLEFALRLNIQLLIDLPFIGLLGPL